MRQCNELLIHFGRFKNPLLEQKQSTLVRLKKEWDDFKEQIEQTETGMCMCFLLLISAKQF